jgi:AcrR family transcriptional regulator
MESKRSLASRTGDDPFPTGHREQRTSASTRDSLLDAALDRFSRSGYRGTSIRDLARAVGIRESSVYKHFASKQAIFDALIARADARLAAATAPLGIAVSTGEEAAGAYRGIGEERLLQIARSMFDFVLHDQEFTRLRRLLAIERYHDAGASARFRDYFIGRPLAFQTDLFRRLLASGEFRDDLDPEQTALAFFGPIHLLVDLADGGDEQEALRLLTGHVRHFRQTHLAEDR